MKKVDSRTFEYKNNFNQCSSHSDNKIGRKNRGSLKIGSVDQLYVGKDNPISSIRLRIGKKLIELQ